MHQPDAGGVKLPPAVRQRTEQRIRHYAEKHSAGKYTRLEIRFRAQFCYIDAYTEPSVPKDWPPEEWQETREQYIERLRNTPTPLPPPILWRRKAVGLRLLRLAETNNLVHTNHPRSAHTTTLHSQPTRITDRRRIAYHGKHYETEKRLPDYSVCRGR